MKNTFFHQFINALKENWNHLFQRILRHGSSVLLIGCVVLPISFTIFHLLILHEFTWNHPLLIGIFLVGLYCLGLFWLFFNILQRGKKRFSISVILITVICMGVGLFYFSPKQCSLTPASKRMYISKESIAMVLEALKQYAATAQKKPSDFSDLEPFIHHIGIQKTGLIDSNLPEKLINCGHPRWRCITLDNGATLAYQPTEKYPTNTELAVIRVVITPVSPSEAEEEPDRPSEEQNAQAIALYLSKTGTVYTDATLPPNAHSSLRAYQPHPDQLPEWLKGKQIRFSPVKSIQSPKITYLRQIDQDKAD